jgi:predicted DNA binding CopG/RHH family protein
MRKTKEHREIEEAFRNGTLEDVPASEHKKYQEWAKAQAKDTVISLRINGLDLSFLKAKAAKKGKKYQTYIGEILHREAQKAA